jgi:hypothetical protein
MKNARKYCQLVEFWKSDQVSDGQGGTYSKYQLDFADFALVITKAEAKTIAQGQLILEGFFEIYLRFRSDVMINKSHLIKVKNLNLTIHSIENVNELDKEIKLIASESDNSTEVFPMENPYENYQ